MSCHPSSVMCPCRCYIDPNPKHSLQINSWHKNCQNIPTNFRKNHILEASFSQVSSKVFIHLRLSSIIVYFFFVDQKTMFFIQKGTYKGLRPKYTEKNLATTTQITKRKSKCHLKRPDTSHAPTHCKTHLRWSTKTNRVKVGFSVRRGRRRVTSYGSYRFKTYEQKSSIDRAKPSCTATTRTEATGGPNAAWNQGFIYPPPTPTRLVPKPDQGNRPGEQQAKQKKNPLLDLLLIGPPPLAATHRTTTSHLHLADLNPSKSEQYHAAKSHGAEPTGSGKA